MAEQLERTVDFSAVIEPTYGNGTPETTTFTKGFYIFRSGNIHRIETERRNLQPLKRTMTSSGEAVGRQLQVFTPSFNLMGHGGAPSDFRLGTLFRMAGFEEDVDAPFGRVDYKYRSSGFESGAVSVYYDDVEGNGILWTAKGCVATFTMQGRAGEEITIDSEIRGLYTAPVEQAAPTVTYPTGGSLVHTMKDEGCTIQINGGSLITPVWKSFSFTAGWTISERRDANSPEAMKGLRLTRREPTLQMVIEANSTEVAEIFASMRTGAAAYHTIHWIHGPSNGEQNEFTMTGQLMNTPEQVDTDLRTLQLEYALFHPTTDDGECILGAI